MNIKLLDFRELHGFASGAGMGFFDELLYLATGDASNILVLDKSWMTLESFPLSPKEGSPDHDLKAAVMLQVSKQPFLLVLGSGSFEATGSKCLLVKIPTRSVEEIDLSIFYNRIRETGLQELNITGATVMDDKMILCSKGSREGAGTSIIVTSLEFWTKQQDADIALAKLEYEPEQETPITASGLAYSYDNDWLIVTASEEGIPGNIDGTLIGDSYIGIIENASRKIGRKRIKVKDVFNLSKTVKQFEGYKVASVCIQADKKEKLKLHLAAEKENGAHFLFKVRLKE